MYLEFIVPVSIFAASSSITPGPNNVMIMTSGLNHGVKKSLPHFFGICLGFTAMMLAIGFGLGALFQQFPMVHLVIKVLGISYILFFAWKIATTKTSNDPASISKPFSFSQAALFQWVNPKAWVMIIGAIATFTALADNMHTQVAIITGIFLAFTIVSVALWMLFGTALKKVIKHPKHQRVFNLTMAALLVISIIPMVF